VTEARYASQCLYLQMTMGTKAGDGLVNLCRHIVRDGMRCVGPFLDDTETDCGLWEPNPKKARFLNEPQC
jgi:hypothetical protein